jgi:hypothetical protein
MTIEPGIAGMITDPAVVVDFSRYGTCRICKAEPGKPCVARYGRIVDGRTEGGPQVLNVAHGHRKRLHGR